MIKASLVLGATVLLLALCLLTQPSAGATLQVPSEYPTIQAAVDAASPAGDTLLIAAGSYGEDVAVHDKSLSLIGEYGAAVTVVSSLHWTNSASYEMSAVRGLAFSDSLIAEDMQWGFLLLQCEIRGTSRIEGFLSREAHLRREGIVIVDCHIASDMRLTTYGASVRMQSSQFDNAALFVSSEYFATIDDCSFVGEGITASAGDGAGIVGSQFFGGSGISVVSHSCEISLNTLVGTAGISAAASSVNLRGNTVVGCPGDALRVGGQTINILGNLVAFNSVGIRLTTVPTRVECNDVWRNAGGGWIGIPDPTGSGGNISVDPLFCSVENDNYHLMGGSPCLPGYHPDGADCGLIGALGQDCGGPTRVMPSTWGQIKARYGEPDKNAKEGK